MHLVSYDIYIYIYVYISTEEECHEQQIGAEGGSELLQDNLEECIATPIPSTSNKTKEQSTEHQEFEIKNYGKFMLIVIISCLKTYIRTIYHII